MDKLISALVAALLSFVAISAHAGLGRQYFEQQVLRTVEGEYLLVTDLYDNPVAYGTVVNTMQKAGYLMTSGTEATTRMDTQCKIDVHTTERIHVECYTPNAASFDLVVSKHIWWTPQQFKADYADVPALVSELRTMHRRAAAALSQRPTQVLFVPTF